jgi:hypothetical protein
LVLPATHGECIFKSGVELVWRAEPTYSGDRRPALLNIYEATIASGVADTINSTPFIGVSDGWTDRE